MLLTVCDCAVRWRQTKGVTRSQGPDKTHRINLPRGWTFCTGFTSGLLLRHDRSSLKDKWHSEAPKAPSNNSQSSPPSLSGRHIISPALTFSSRMRHHGEHRRLIPALFFQTHYAAIGRPTVRRADPLKLRSVIHFNIFRIHYVLYIHSHMVPIKIQGYMSTRQLCLPAKHFQPLTVFKLTVQTHVLHLCGMFLR